MDYRKSLKDCKRVVFKFGTNVVTKESGHIAVGTVYSLIEAIADLHYNDTEIIIVTSGAVGMGRKVLNINAKPSTLDLKQACAAVGQCRLMYLYEEGFEKLSISVAQILLTEEDFSNRKRYLNLRSALEKLLELKVIPIINENDVVSTSELENDDPEFEKIACFGDNDKLSALVMSKLDADLLVILSDVDGFYDSNPKTNPDAKLIHTIKKIDSKVEQSCSDTCSDKSRGGMKTKIEAARIAVNSGGAAIIAQGKDPNVIQKIFAGEQVGTLFLPVANLSSRKRWIAYATSITGKVIVNKCAKKALVENNASLLPIGVTKVKSKFKAGDVVSILDEDGNEFARGIINFSKDDAAKLLGLHTDEIKKILKNSNQDTLISRDNIVILDV